LGFFLLEKQFANIPDRGFLFLRNTLLPYSLGPYSRTERLTESQIHLLCMGWRNLFSSCAVGMVQAWVGQKSLKRDILRLFLMSEVELWTLFQQIQMQYDNLSTIYYSYY
jgi:hypothetical protein